MEESRTAWVDVRVIEVFPDGSKLVEWVSPVPAELYIENGETWVTPQTNTKDTGGE